MIERPASAAPRGLKNYEAGMTETNAPDTFAWPIGGFTCFHCGDVFNNVKDARDHFGNDINDEPGCILKLKGDDKGLLALVRLQYHELDAYRREDQPIMRKIYELGSKHRRECSEAEQCGYDRGLRDGQVFLASKPLPSEVVMQIEAELLTGVAQREIARRRGISHGKIRGVAREMKRREMRHALTSATPSL